MRSLLLLLVVYGSARADDWGDIMRPVRPVKAAVREPDEDTRPATRAIPAGHNVGDVQQLEGGYFYKLHADGYWWWCDECNGVSHDEFARRAKAKQQQSQLSQPAPAAPTRGVSGSVPFHNGHDCPNCHYTSPAGQGTWVQVRSLPNGQHVHACPQCGQSWRH